VRTLITNNREFEAERCSYIPVLILETWWNVAQSSVWGCC